MARINIEDKIFGEEWFCDLLLRLGSKTMALGAFAEACFMAQKHYLNEENNRLIPHSEWLRLKCGDALIASGFAIEKELGIYIRGSHKQFAWLIQSVENGRKGGLKRAENALKKITRPLTPPSPPLNSVNPLTLTPTLTLKTKEGGNSTPMTDQIMEAWEVWVETCSTFGVTKTNISIHEERSLQQAIRMITLENVKLALEGKRYEQKFDGYNPAENLAIHQILGPDKRGNYRWEKFANMASAKNNAISERLTDEELDEIASGKKQNA